MTAAKRRRSLGVDWYLPNRKRPFTSTTVATSDLLSDLAGAGLTFNEARRAVLWDADAHVVLDAFIAAGHGPALMTDLKVSTR